MKYILGFDIGNTKTTLGIYGKSDISPVRTFKFKSERAITSEELGKKINGFLDNFKEETKKDIHIEGIAFSSVVTEVNRLYHEMSKKYFNLDPLEIDCNVKLGITLNYDNPEELGADRITNAVAAYRDYGKDCIIVDLGTAITFCVLLSNGIFDGGLIAPGVGIAIDALSENTSKLIKVDFEDPKKVVARNSMSALKSGFFYGWLSMISGIITRIENEYNKKFLLLLTGGYSDIVSKSLDKDCKTDPLLTMKGIKYIYDMNC